MSWKARLRSKTFWVTAGAFIALTGKVFGLYEVPAGFENWWELLLTLLSAAGIIISHHTPGIKD